MTRVLHIINGLGTSGAEAMLVRLAAGLNARIIRWNARLSSMPDLVIANSQAVMDKAVQRFADIYRPFNSDE